MDDKKEILVLAKKVYLETKAYKEFLDSLNIDGQKLKSVSDIPITNKKNYIEKFDLDELLSEHFNIEDAYLFSTSSGSTSMPTIWPRSYEIDSNLVAYHTNYLDSLFAIKSKKSLVVICFGMGTFTPGLMHFLLSLEEAKKSKISVITPGTTVQHTINLVEKLHAYFDQVIFMGYPPLLKEVVDTAISQKVDVKKWKAKIVYAGENMSFSWRNTLSKALGQTHEEQNVVGLYGCSETGMLGLETKSVSQFYKICSENRRLNEILFGSPITPTIVEPLPDKFFEVSGGELLVSVDQPIPLVRFNLHDFAVILTSKKINFLLSKLKIAEQVTKGKMFLAILGRNNGNFFTLEEIRWAIEKSDPSKKISAEFNYSEIKENGINHVTISLFSEQFGQINIMKMGKSIKKTLINLKQSKNFFEIELKIEPLVKRKGYVSGKFKYFV